MYVNMARIVTLLTVLVSGCCQKPQVELFRTSGLVCPNDTSVFVCITSGVNLIWTINNNPFQTYNSQDDTVGTLSIYSNNNNSHVPADVTVFVVLARADAKGQYSDCSSVLEIKPSAYILDTLKMSCMAHGGGPSTTAIEIFSFTTGIENYFTNETVWSFDRIHHGNTSSLFRISYQFPYMNETIKFIIFKESVIFAEGSIQTSQQFSVVSIANSHDLVGKIITVNATSTCDRTAQQVTVKDLQLSHCPTTANKCPRPVASDEYYHYPSFVALLIMLSFYFASSLY